MADGPQGVIFEVDEQTVVNGVDYEFQRLLRWREPVVTPDGTRVAIPRDGRGIEDQTIDLLEPTPQLIKGVRGDSVGAYGEQTITYKVPGQVWYTTDDGATLQEIPGGLAQFVQDAGDVIVDRRGWGAKVGEIEVLDSIEGDPGEYVDLNLPHQINERTDQTPKAQRGGTRKVQVAGATEKPGTRRFQIEDAGNLAQTMPEPEDPVDDAAIPVPEFTLAASSESPLTIAEATVTNDTDLEDFGAVVEWEYAISATEPTGDGTAFGPLALGFGVDVIALPEVPSGSKVWARARAQIVSTGERSDWSAWQDITLGPDDDGTGGTLQPFTLALQLDSAGVLAATTDSVVAAITKIYFLAGLAGGAAPLYANVIAVGDVDSSGPPFTAAALATLAEGEVRTVGAIGEDDLGNRTTLVTATIQRTVDGGVTTGTPGNWSHNFVPVDSGTFVLGAHSADVEPLGTGKYLRVLVAGGFVRGQATVVVAGYVTAYLDCRVSLDGGETWETDLLGLRVPLRDPDGLIGTQGFVQAVGLAVAVDPAFVGEVLLDPVVAGGDDTAVPEIQNFIVESTSAEPPPADGEDEPIAPGVPASVTYQWEVTEGSGQIVANKKIGGVTADLILGDNDTDGTRDPTWTAGPRRLDTAGFLTIDHHYAHYDGVPSLAAGCAIFFYGDIASLGSLAKYLCGVEDGGSQDHVVAVDGSNHAIAQVTEDTGGGTTRTATGTTSIVNGSKHVYGLLHVPTGAGTGTLGIYVDPIDGLPEGTATCGAPREAAGAPRKFVMAAARTPPGGGGADSFAFGDVYFFAGTDATSLTPDDIAALYQQFKLTYTALP